MIDTTLLDLVKQIKERLVANHSTISVAESCTGGLLASCLTSLEGASNYFTYGFITYSNQAKISLLNISSHLIEQFGAVSQEVAEAMALGAIHKANSSIAVAITGIAGPGGGTPDKPVGTVWIAIIVNSGEFGTRSDGAKPICNGRAMSNDVTNFSSIDYTWQANIKAVTSTTDQSLMKSPTMYEIPNELISIKHNFITKSYLSMFNSINSALNSLDNRQMIRYLSCKKALQLILQNIT